MSVAHYIVLSEGLEGSVDGSMDGKALAHQADFLADLAKSVGVSDLWIFHSENPDDVAAFLEPEDLDAATRENPALPAEEWFEPAAGLRTVRALLAALEKDPPTMAEIDLVIVDLKQVERILSAAQSQGGKFHLSVDF